MSIIIFITAVYNSAKRHSDVADVLSNGKVELDEVGRLCQVPGTLDFLFYTS